MTLLLQGKTAIVTGGTAGIGAAIAKEFARNGAFVAILGTNEQRGSQVVAEMKAMHECGGASFYVTNVADAQSVESTFKTIVDERKQIDILVNNAGITKDQLLMKMSEEDWDTVLDVNAKSCFLTCRTVIRGMLRAKKGKIINISSVVGLTGNAGQINYAASKAAVIGLTKSLAKEVAARNIQVNCIAPGYIETAMTEALTEEQKNGTLEKIPMGRMGQPNEIALAALFLASQWSDYITGQVITVDGGMVM
jgi:3-oxoacyl-[acyl-carrier protein] reductase